MPPLNVALVPGPDQVVVRLTGDADMSTVPLLSDALTQGAGLGTRQVVVDIAGASFWDCSGLHALATFTGELAAAGRSCRIVGALAATRRLIGLADLTGRLVLDGPLPARPTSPPAPVRRAVPARRPVSGHPVPVRGAQSPVAAGRFARRD
ncbi:STAS domain-containing protein [Blastococcus sp. CT_GayMR16]|uniref:STAS domain-containing protein n=1 Tax=Blastococcus sp. CT_GayMR16 TaxID=2559607 RepID=UPI00107440EF|nr:STAS domain-containing protein [Blastococcus sp. CT_GayMR16]TFV85971.1 anti-sigma factor antagonist [Blastococcus sp. CT_GayMR16]